MRYIEFGTEDNPVHIGTDGWAAYGFLDEYEPFIDHRETFHNIEWGFGLNSTNPIEQLWAWIKWKVKSVYKFFPPQTCQEFIVEALWRRKKELQVGESLEEILSDNIYE